MCDPVSMFAATSAASLGSALMGANSDAAEYDKKVKALNAEGDALMKSTIFKYQMTSLAQQQAQDKAQIEVGEKKLALSDTKGTAGAAAATAGVEGLSVDALLRGYDVATGSDIALTYLQRDNEVAQSRAEQKGINMDATNRLTSLKQQVPDDPTTKMLGRLFGAAFNIGGAYAQYTTPVKNPDGSTSRRFG